MRKIKFIFGAALISAVCLILTGCGKEKVSVTKYIEPVFSGYDGYGKVSVEGLYDWTDDVIKLYGDHITSDKQAREMEKELKKVVTYKVSPESGISNGDTVTVSVDIGKKAEEYGFILEGSDVTFTVENLEEIQDVDPFDSVKLIFEGTAPNGTLRIESDDNTVSFTADKAKGLSNGDEITVTAAPRHNSTMEQYVNSYGKRLIAEKKTFTVEGLTSYVMAIEDISEDMMKKMNVQADDTITAHCASWAEGNSLNKMELLGNYLLTVKEGFNANPKNELYFVYKVYANLTGATMENKDDENQKGTDEYYTFVKFSDIVNLPDGTTSVDLSKAAMANKNTDSTYGSRGFFGSFNPYTFKGYPDLDSMFNDVVTKNIEKYSYVSTVK